MSNHRLFYILFALILTSPVFMSTIEAIIIAIIEGITEYLPISSTGHMIIAEKFLGIDVHEGFTKTFTVAIQLGAILSVVVLYWKKFFDFSRWQFYAKLVAAVIPALALGFLLSDKIDALLESRSPWLSHYCWVELYYCLLTRFLQTLL